jgi:hypothetical protein
MSAGEFGTVENIKDGELITDAEILDLHSASKERSKQREKELDREKAKDFDYVGAYRYSHFICNPKCGYVVDRRDEGVIQEHKETCPWCIELRQQKQAEEQARLDGHLKMEYILHMIKIKEEEIEHLKRKIAKERKEKLLNWKKAIEMIEYDIRDAKHTIEREQNIELPKLLNDENEITRKAAQEMYDDDYLKKMSEKEEEDRRLGKY